MMSHANRQRRAFVVSSVVVAGAVIGACSSADLPEPRMSRPSFTLTSAQQIAVPAYFFDWSGLLPNVPPANVIVINPNNGPNGGSNYASQISDAHVKGARVLGYVYTEYANNKTVAQVNAEIDQYYSLYPSLDGIFEDQVTGGSDCAHAQSYYQPIYDHIKAAHSGATVIINPGGPVDACYLSAASIVVTFENTFSVYQSSWTTSGRDWETAANAGRIWHIVHTASASQLATALELSRARNAGYVYVTDRTAAPGVNTFGALPPYFSTEVANVNSWNGYVSAAPALSRWRASNDGVNEHYSVHFSQPFAFYRVYIDSDHSAATGYPIAGLGADYVIENSTLYVHGAPGWNWTWAGSSGQVATVSSVEWTVPRSVIGESAYPNTASVAFEAQSSGSAAQNAGKYEHVYSASSGSISGYFAENDGDNVYYQADFGSAFAWKHVFIDADMNAATGYAVAGIGADYVIENDVLYRYTGGSWTSIAFTPATGGATGTKTWTVPRATLGETAATGELANVVFDGSGGFTQYTTPVYRHVYTR